MYIVVIDYAKLPQLAEQTENKSNTLMAFNKRIIEFWLIVYLFTAVKWLF